MIDYLGTLIFTLLFVWALALYALARRRSR